jgi:transcriptional regulator with XRE-family HTH domain
MAVFGARIKAVRESVGLTQAQLADVLGVGRSHVAAVETNHTGISTEIVARLYDLYGISPTWLITGKGQMREEAVA